MKVSLKDNTFGFEINCQGRIELICGREKKMHFRDGLGTVTII